MLRFKIDENLPTEAAALIQAAGHECHTVFDEGLAGTPDPVLSERCRAEGRVCSRWTSILRTFVATHPIGLPVSLFSAHSSPIANACSGF